MTDEAQKWIKKLAGDRYVEPKEESRALPSFMYGNPEDSLDRIRIIREAQDKNLNKGRKNGHKSDIC